MSYQCPICQMKLTPVERSFRCENNHTFDLAKQGYVNLLPVQNKRSKAPGDSAEMVAARQQWLDLGHYAPILDFLYTALEPVQQSLDCGCGEGYYTHKLRQKSAQQWGSDISKFAVVAAAKRDKESHYSVCSNRELAYLASSFDRITCLFGFPVASEFRRVLKNTGELILLDAGPHHLLELREACYQDVRIKPITPHDDLLEQFELLETTPFTTSMLGLDSDATQALLKMTPHYFRGDKAMIERCIDTPPSAITIDVVLRRYRPI